MGRACRRVSVNNYCAERPAVREELFTDPQQVALCLLIERHAGANASVNEEIVTNANAEIEIGKELNVFGRHHLVERFGRNRPFLG